MHVHDIQLEAAPDRVIWEYAIKNALVIVTKDADFAQRSDLQGTAPPQIVWVRLGNLRRKALIAEFSRLMPDIERAIANGIRITQLP